MIIINHTRDIVGFCLDVVVDFDGVVADVGVDVGADAFETDDIILYFHFYYYYFPCFLVFFPRRFPPIVLVRLAKTLVFQSSLGAGGFDDIGFDTIGL